MKTHPELISLCTACKKHDCPDGECPDYIALARKLEAAKPRSRYYAAGNAEKPTRPASCTAQTLERVNRAIEALSDLLNDPAADLFVPGRGAATKLLEQMRGARFNRCINLIDWEAVAAHMNKEAKND